jgi:hypothetical protein
MRWLVFAIAITAATPAHAEDGYYVEQSFGGGGYHGELARYGEGAPRVQLGFGVRRGPFTVEGFFVASVPDLFFVDCYAEECAYAASPLAGLGTFGLDLRKRWRVFSVRRWSGRGTYERPGVFFALHGGLRWFRGDQALDGYAGPGLGGGAAIEGDLWVLGYFVDFGLDVLRMQGHDDVVHASTPYFMIGTKLGWL